MPIHAELFRIRAGSRQNARGPGRQLAGRQAHLPLPSVGWLRPRSRPAASREPPASRFPRHAGPVPLIIHGPQINHRPGLLLCLAAALVNGYRAQALSPQTVAAGSDPCTRGNSGPWRDECNGHPGRGFSRRHHAAGRAALAGKHQPARGTAGRDQRRRALHVHVPRRRAEADRAGGLSRNGRLAARETRGDKPVCDFKHASVGADAGAAGRAGGAR